MTSRPQEVTEFHARLLRSALEVDEARAYWAHASPSRPATPQRAFDEYWFGARSLPRVTDLLSNMRLRYDAFPVALDVLHRWPDMSPEARRLICHWHLQLTDPIYRRFTGHFLAERRAGARPTVTRDLIVSWVTHHTPEHWTVTTRIQYASKLLSAAFSAGLLGSNRDPRPLTLPRVPPEALEYLLYLLRETDFAGSLVDNPYLASVGLEDGFLEDRLRALPGLAFRRQGDLTDFGWRHRGLRAWADINLATAAWTLAAS